jgi:Sulfatase-modifying factor enzyme 1
MPGVVSCTQAVFDVRLGHVRAYAGVVTFVLSMTACDGAPAAGFVADAGAVGAESVDASLGPVTCPHVPVERRCKGGYCLIPAGCFIKGSPPDEPYRARHREELQEVTLTKSFLMQQHEVTQAEWTAMGFKNLAGTKSYPEGKDCTEPTCPASTMTWFEATHFANEKSRQEGLPACIELLGCTGAVGVDFVCSGYRQTTPSYYECKGYRLPTHYEFEYATRAGTRTAFLLHERSSTRHEGHCARLPARADGDATGGRGLVTALFRGFAPDERYRGSHTEELQDVPLRQSFLTRARMAARVAVWSRGSCACEPFSLPSSSRCSLPAVAVPQG